MNNGTIEGKVNPWEYMCERWNQFAPPGRPSKDDINTMRTMMYDCLEPDKENYHVLLLGATPEIRDMLAEDSRITTILVDITIDMIVSMGRLMQNNTEHEIWMKSSWIDAPLEKDYFDVVLSDLVICNVEYSKHDMFYSKIASLLRPNGHWINRVYSINGNTIIRSLDELLFEYSKKEQLTKADINNFRSTAGLIAWKKEERLLDWKLLYEEMTKYQVNGIFSHENPKYVEILERTYELFKPFNKKYYLDTETETEVKMRNFFSIHNRYEDFSVSDLHEKGYYIYDLVKSIGDFDEK